uniref:Peptidyl-prolyl cis-trans isomerase n=1 Tax=Macrostomum lignano TaxID=282301 RepID=A0A1I8IFX3_9PLAT
MSSIYVLEPPTNGRVLLQTTVGNIDIELWSKEAPKACYYDDTLFHRVVKDFIVQGGDPTGTGEGGDSVFGKPFGLELHSRLRFNRRGLVGMACLQPGQNGSQFFFTLAATPELEKHNTIFGQVVGNSLFNMLRLAECETDQQERPLNPQRIISARVIDNPYPDLAPREEQLELRRRRQHEQQLKQQEESEAAKSGFGYK